MRNRSKSAQLDSSLLGIEMDILQLIEELEDEFGKGKNFLFSKKSLVNLERCGELIDELKNSLPTAIQEVYSLAKRENLNSSETNSRKNT